jgi:hypothetical protein
VAFEGCSAFDGVLRGMPVPEAMRELITHELHFARIRHSRVDASEAAGGVGVDASGKATTAAAAAPRASVELPEHVKRQIAGVAGAQTSVVALAAVVDDAAAADAAPSRRNFLTEAANKFRSSAMARSRLTVASSGPSGSAEGAGTSSSGAGAASGPGGVAVAGPSGEKFPVFFRYHEGFTNAVKRPLLISEFL